MVEADNVHRSNVQGILLGLQNSTVAAHWLDRLLSQKVIGQEIDALINAAHSCQIIETALSGKSFQATY